MGFATQTETWLGPITRDWDIFFGVFFSWFIVQWGFTRWWGSHWPGLTAAQREDVIIRSCSIVNGFLMSISAFIFLRNFHANNYSFPDESMYRALPYYRFSRMAIVSYFAWDIVVCFVYRWSLAWKVHAVFSFLGCYALAFPFADDYGGYYSGCFELSNGFLHMSAILRLIGSDEVSPGPKREAFRAKLNGYATISEYLFALLFLLVRVIGGTYVTGSWLRYSLPRLYSDVVNRGVSGYQPQLHDELAVLISAVAVSIIQGLQYIWFSEIVKKATGAGQPAAKDETKKKD